MLVIAICAGAIGVATVSSAQTNPVQEENNRAGTNAWRLRNQSDDLNKQIKGYADKTSVNIGDTIDFHVSVNRAQTFDIDIYRLGHYGGARGRLMTSIGPIDGNLQDYPPIDLETGFLEYDWPVSHRLTIPSNWVSGIYLAKLTNAEGYDNYVGFVVRNDSQQADLLFQRPIITDHAYNDFPDVDPSTPGYDPNNPAHIGKSMYGGGGGNTSIGEARAIKISMDRPMSGNGVGLLFTWELDLLAWLESEGYDVTYSTNIDTHKDPGRLRDFKGFISPAHDEYWTDEMFTAAEQARDNGVGLAFMGGNAVYYQVKLQPAGDGTANRAIFTYKNHGLDPEPVRLKKTGRFRDIGRPEQSLIGIQYIDYGPSERSDMIVTETDHWVYDGTDLRDGDKIPKVIGSEIDIFDTRYPAPNAISQTLLAASPYQGTIRGNHIQNTSIYQAPSGAWVFATGTLSWGWGLGRSGHISTDLQQMTRNVFDRMIDEGGGGGGGGNGEGVEVTVRVRGIRGGEIVELQDADNNRIVRQELGTEWREITATVPEGSDLLYVAFVNDGINSEGQNRDMLVDYVEWTATGEIVQAESVESKGVWDGTDCNIGFRDSQYLACNGWFKFEVPQSGGGGSTTTTTTRPTTTTTDGGGGGSAQDITFTARGTTGSETVELIVDDQVVRQWTLSTNNQAYTHTHNGAIGTVLVEFTNDGRTSSGADRNIIVESAKVGTQQFDPTAVKSKGVWDGTDCDIGFRNSKFLACNGWFEFIVDDDGTPPPPTTTTTTTRPGGGGGDSTETFSVRLRGTTGTEQATIEVDGDVIASSPLNIDDSWMTLNFDVDSDAQKIRVNFINDERVSSGDRNLIVDWVEFGGDRTTAANLRAKGVWDGSSCDVEKVHGTGYIACNGWVELNAAD